MSSITLQVEVASFYRSWATFVARKVGAEQAILVLADDLSDLETLDLNFESFDDVSAALKRLMVAVSNSLDSFAEYAEYTLQKLKQSQAYLDHVISGRIPRTEDIEQRGIAVTETSNEELDSLYLKFNNAAKESGYLDNPYSTKALDSRFAIKLLRERAEYFALKMESVFSRDLAPIEYSIEALDSQLAWSNVVITENKKCKLIFNINRIYTAAFIDYLALHEICGHVFHFCQLRQNRILQSRSSHLLCIGVHTQDVVQVEGVAQLITGFLLQQFGAEESLAHAENCRRTLNLALISRNIPKILAGEITIDEATVFHSRFLPGNENSVRSMYARVSIDPFYFANYMSYHYSFKLLEPLIALPSQAISRTLRDLYTSILSPSQLHRLVERALA